ncbi:hypothetical protein [Sphingobacterium bambusae]
MIKNIRKPKRLMVCIVTKYGIVQTYANVASLSKNLPILWPKRQVLK